MQRRSSILLLSVVLATGLHAGERVPEGLDPMPATDVARLNDTFGANSEKYDTPPRVLKAYTPVYPASRLLSGQTGACKVSFVIGVDGRATDAKADPDADAKMCDHALYALRHWEFSPAMKDGRPTTAGFRMPFNYDIR